MKKSDWVWMPHAGHLIVGNDCRFHLNTYVGKYIVSTVGEWWPDTEVRKIHARIHDEEWLEKNKELMGDYFDREYFKKFGFMEIGAFRKYETMVFEARKSNDKCCPYEIIVDKEVDFSGYNKSEDAYKGHLKLCEKWSKK